MLESQEFRRVVLGEDVPDLGIVNNFSEDPLLFNPGRCGSCAGGVAGGSFGVCTPPF
jgi:hypothetical protein